ncbi:MAG: GNAT family N-acetyltransferase [Pontixanthobacter sp.]
MTDWNIRLARPADAVAMPAIERAAGAMFDDIEGLAELARHDAIDPDRLLRYIAKGHCLIAQSDGRPVGFLANQPFGRELHIWEMNVLPTHQRRGIGSALVRGCLIDARNAGFAAVTLTTFRDVPWNGPFYETLGFDEVTALDAHPRLAGELALEADRGLPAERRCAMIRFLAD